MKIVLSVYTYGGIPRALFEATLLELTSAPQDVEFKLLWPNEDALICRARSMMAHVAMSCHDADVWMQVDHDIGYRPGDLVGICRKALETKGVVGGLYPFKRPGSLVFPWRPAPSVPKEMTIGKDELLSALMVNTGFMAVHVPTLRDAVEKLKTATDPDLRLHLCTTDGENGWWDPFRTVVRAAEAGKKFDDYQSEDWAFCWRMREMGVPVHAWTKPFLSHYGSFPYSAMTLKQEAPGA